MNFGRPVANRMVTPSTSSARQIASTGLRADAGPIITLLVRERLMIVDSYGQGIDGG